MGDADSVRCPAEGGDLIAPAAPAAEEAVEPANLDARLAAAIVRVRAISETLTAFAEGGCTVTDQLLACVVTIPLTAPSPRRVGRRGPRARVLRRPVAPAPIP